MRYSIESSVELTDRGKEDLKTGAKNEFQTNWKGESVEDQLLGSGTKRKERSPLK